jgi:AraC family transcriptional regulator
MPVLINPPVSEFGRTTAILKATGRRHHVRDFPGPLSIKTVLRGAAHWKTEAGQFRIDESSLLILNRSEPYSLTIDSPEPVSTLCLFFQDGLVEAVRRAIVATPEQLIDEPERASDFRFAPRSHATAECRAVVAGMQSLSSAVSADGLALESGILRIARELALLDGRTRAEAARVPAARPATREEIYHRLCRAREFMRARHDQPIQLSDIARSACLSTYHFHRLFKETFRETPHAFVTRQRLARARRLLAEGELAITGVCAACGFESLGSFSAMFRRRFGASPRMFRGRPGSQQIDRENS